MKQWLTVAMFAACLAGGPVYASIFPYPEQDAKIFEPKQNALIAWNGKKEILSMAFSMKASEPVEILRVLPFPSEPKIKKADPLLFDKAVKTLNKKLTPGSRSFPHARMDEALKQFAPLEAVAGLPSPAAAASLPPPGMVTSHERIGIHDVTTVKLLNVTGFTDWVKDYFLAKGLPEAVIRESVKNVISQYIKEGRVWFVFDAVSIDKDTREIEILEYAFDTDSLYYPLKIAKTVEGDTDINLIVITSNLISNFTGISSDEIKLCNPPLGFNKEEVRTIDDSFDALFNLGFNETAEVRIWNIKGEARKFEKDLLAK